MALQVTVNTVLLAPVPPGPVTVITPVLASERTSALISVDDTTVIFADGMPPIVTCVAPVKFVPVIVTKSGNLPDVGLNDVTVGAAVISAELGMSASIPAASAANRTTAAVPNRRFETAVTNKLACFAFIAHRLRIDAKIFDIGSPKGMATSVP